MFEILTVITIAISLFIIVGGGYIMRHDRSPVRWLLVAYITNALLYLLLAVETMIVIRELQEICRVALCDYRGYFIAVIVGHITILLAISLSISIRLKYVLSLDTDTTACAGD